MLDFFRRYQRYFFMVITIVIIISFSFFGSYNQMSSSHPNEQVVFQAVDGSSIKRSDLEEMAYFLGSDSFDKKLSGGSWGPNFLNDGVIVNDFFKTGLAKIIVASYSPELEKDFSFRLEREKRYHPYVHPEAKFLSVENAWNYFYPAMKANYEQLKLSDSALSDTALNARVQLYLNQREFPPAVMRQVLLQQQKQYSWLREDPNLEYTDFSLYGYSSLEDWFGPRFVRLISAFIINTAKIAEQKGYKVSKDEALADLMRNAVISYNENAQNPYLGVTNASDYYQEQLRRLGMDQTKAVKVWQQVMLFRRLFDDVSNTVLNDPLSTEQFNQYTQQMIGGNLFQLPKNLQLNDFRQLQKFEAYLDAVAQKRKDKDLQLPTKFLSPEEVFKNHPELVEKRYLVEMAQISKNQLQSKVGVKETWNWETQDNNWQTLKKQFPELGIKKGDTKEERFQALESLDDKTRQRVDQYARNAIVDGNSEMISKALSQAPVKTLTLSLHPKGKNKQFPGLENPQTLLTLLDEAPLNEFAPGLDPFTADKNAYYRIKVQEREPGYQIYTFAEADQENVLDAIVDKQLETYYKKVRESHPELFQNELKNWKPFSEVKNKVAELYYANIIDAIKQDYAKAIAPEKAPGVMLGDYAASLRFYSYMRNALEQLRQNPLSSSKIVLTSNDDASPRNEQDKLSTQWKLEKEEVSINRGQSEKMKDAFQLAAGEWTKVHHFPNGELSFFEVTKKGEMENGEEFHKKLNAIQLVLGDEAQQVYLRKLLDQIKTRKAISLDYLSFQPEAPEMD